MGWYGTKLDFEKRNLINKKIGLLKEMAVTVAKIKEVVFQNAKLAKTINWNLLESNQMSSYPVLRDMMAEADAKALDNPWQFSNILTNVLEWIKMKIGELSQEREEMFEDKSKKKGLQP